MTAPSKPWETTLQSSSNVLTSVNPNTALGRQLARNAPVPAPALPPRPSSSPAFASSYSPYSSYNSVGGYGGYGSIATSPYSSYGMPYRSSVFGTYGTGSYGGYGGGYGMYGMSGYPNGYGQPNDAEARFIQYAEQSSRRTFANVESIVRAFNSLSMMLDNTFFAMTSSFRAVLGVAENFGRLRTMFGHIWHSINVFRLAIWLYRRCLSLLGIGRGPRSETAVAWKQAAGQGAAGGGGSPSGSNWPTLAFLGVLVSAPYFISKFLLRYEDKSDPVNWKTPGVKARAVFDFVATAPNELSLQLNDDITLAPTTIQEEMGLKNTGWAFAVCGGKSGVVPLNYLVLKKPQYSVLNNSIPVPRDSNNGPAKPHTKRVSFGENQVFENVDLEDYVTGKKTPIFDRPNDKKTAHNAKPTETNVETTESTHVETVFTDKGDKREPSLQPSVDVVENGVKSSSEVPQQNSNQTEDAFSTSNNTSKPLP